MIYVGKFVFCWFEQHFYTRVILKVQYGSRFFTVRVLLILQNMTVRVVLIGVDYINKEFCVWNVFFTKFIENKWSSVPKYHILYRSIKIVTDTSTSPPPINDKS